MREHLFRLSAAGIGPKQVEILAGVGKTAQWKIRSQRVRKCLDATREAILAVGCDDHIFMRSHIDATRAREIVEGLRGYGMAKSHIAKALGYRSRCLQIPSASTCTLRTLRRLEVLRELVIRQAGEGRPAPVAR